MMELVLKLVFKWLKVEFMKLFVLIVLLGVYLYSLFRLFVLLIKVKLMCCVINVILFKDCLVRGVMVIWGWKLFELVLMVLK